GDHVARAQAHAAHILQVHPSDLLQRAIIKELGGANHRAKPEHARDLDRARGATSSGVTHAGGCVTALRGAGRLPRRVDGTIPIPLAAWSPAYTTAPTAPVCYTAPVVNAASIAWTGWEVVATLTTPRGAAAALVAVALLAGIAPSPHWALRCVVRALLLRASGITCIGIVGSIGAVRWHVALLARRTTSRVVAWRT